MTRQEHLEWCKRRAHEYLKAGDVGQAVTSMLSDINKHPETALNGATAGTLGMLGMMAAAKGDVAEARRFIDGFN